VGLLPPGVRLALLIGPMFGFLGGAMAYLITYEEYSHHHFARGRLIMMSLRTGLVAFIVLMIVALLAAWLIPAVET